MREFYFLEGKEQHGPFTISQLKDKRLTLNTLVWSEGMDNWTQLDKVPELTQALNLKSTPPPPPSDQEVVAITRLQFDQNLKAKPKFVVDGKYASADLKKSNLIWLFAWFIFHAFALLTSYSGIAIFNDRGEPQTEKFWPFVEFVNEDTHFIDDNTAPLDSRFRSGTWEDDFSGVFVQYDWTEFAAYVGLVYSIYYLIRLSKTNE